MQDVKYFFLIIHIFFINYSFCLIKSFIQNNESKKKTEPNQFLTTELINIFFKN